MTVQRQPVTTMSMTSTNERAPRVGASPVTRRFPVQVRSTFVRLPRRSS